MIIEIDATHRLEADTYQWKLQEKKNTKWRSYGYYMSLPGAIRGMAEENLRLSNEKDILVALSKIEKEIQKLGKIDLQSI